MSETADSEAMATSALAIDVQNVTVAYRSYQERPTSLKESLIRFARTGKLKHFSTFNALTDVSFQVRQGRVIGIIGSNGSGKSTLLKVLAGVLVPTAGTVQVTGNITSLIELGAGFDPELNAIENIYLNSSLHKRSRKEIQERVDPILEFAELTEFAQTPIKYYSSGMFARLGFSVATDLNPDILIVDEILGVGDERFQEKCKQVFLRFINEGKTIIIVTHTLDLLSELAQEALLLSRGKVIYSGDPATAINMYRGANYETALGHHEVA